MALKQEVWRDATGAVCGLRAVRHDERRVGRDATRAGAACVVRCGMTRGDRWAGRERGRMWFARSAADYEKRATAQVDRDVKIACPLSDQKMQSVHMTRIARIYALNSASP